MHGATVRVKGVQNCPLPIDHQVVLISRKISGYLEVIGCTAPVLYVDIFVVVNLNLPKVTYTAFHIISEDLRAI